MKTISLQKLSDALKIISIGYPNVTIVGIGILDMQRKTCIPNGAVFQDRIGGIGEIIFKFRLMNPHLSVGI
jgi:hypothetical protein